jgi:hypothetical protein
MKNRLSEALTILADAVIATYVAKHAAEHSSPTPKEGKSALPKPQEEAVMSVPRSHQR